MDVKKKAVLVVCSTAAGALAGYAVQYHILPRFAKELPIEALAKYGGDEVVYGYEEAVKRAAEKIQAQRDAGVAEDDIQDGVKAIGPMPEAVSKEDPDIPWNEDQSSIVMEEIRVEESEMFPYHKVSGGFDPADEMANDPRPELDQDGDAYREADIPDVTPWPTEKVGDYFQIAEDKFKHEEPWFDKMSATYFTVDRVLSGWDGDLEPLKEEEELLRRCFTLASEGEDRAFFRHLDDEKDVEVTFENSSFAEAKAVEAG